MSARSEHRVARAKLQAEATVTVTVTATAPSGMSVTQAWPTSWNAVALQDVTDSGLILEEVWELADRARAALQQKVLGPEPAPTAEEAAADEARRAAREAAHIARCKELGIDPHTREAKFLEMKAQLGR
jgi:hypothetical protein